MAIHAHTVVEVGQTKLTNVHGIVQLEVGRVRREVPCFHLMLSDNHMTNVLDAVNFCWAMMSCCRRN